MYSGKPFVAGSGPSLPVRHSEAGRLLAAGADVEGSVAEGYAAERLVHAR